MSKGTLEYNLNTMVSNRLTHQVSKARIFSYFFTWAGYDFRKENNNLLMDWLLLPTRSVTNDLLHVLPDLWRSILIVLWPVWNKFDEFFFLAICYSMSLSQEAWLFSPYRGCRFSVAPKSFILICQQRRTSSDGLRDSGLTWSFNSYRNGATQSKIDRPMSVFIRGMRKFKWNLKIFFH